ncbi:MAG: DUF1460 domain-containing protein [Syntrophales bacterium]|nr:DUF1460 domain-containing protein [Syntrophales bacterium]
MTRLEDVVVYQSVLDSIVPQDKDRGTVLAEVASFFLEADYQASPLEKGKEETLTINLRAFDCVTFVEQCLAFVLVLRDFRRTWDDYVSTIRYLRYRNGIVEYASRLHYFCDWLNYQVQRGILKNITPELGGIPFEKKINYMTSHRELYLPLSDADVFNRIRATEEALEKSLGCYLPISSVQGILHQLKTGDIVAFTTDREGLDVSHVGITLGMESGELFLIHASREAGKVIRSPMLEYIRSAPHLSGIIVGRLA